VDRKAAAAALTALALAAGCGGETSAPAEPGERVATAAEEHSVEVSAPVEDARTPSRVDEVSAPAANAPAATLSGVVQDPDGEPVAGVEVSTSVPHAEDTRWRTGIEDMTDEAGRFALRFDEPPAEPLDVKAEDPLERYFGVTRYDVAPDSSELRLVLVDYRELELAVRDVSGMPVEAFDYTLVLEQGRASIHTGAEVEAPGGRAVVRVPHLPFELRVSSDAHHDEERGPFAPGAFPERIELVLADLEVVAGRVLFRGDPVEGASVVLVHEMYNPLDEIVDTYSTGLFYGWEDEPVVTDATGAFRIPSRFGHMEYFALATADEFADGLAGPARVGGTPLVVELSEGGGVAGVVRSDKGSVAGLEVLLYRVLPSGRPFRAKPPAGQVHRAVVDANGSYSFEHVRPGDWLVRVLDEAESAPFECRITEGATAALDLDLDEPPACRLAFRLTVGGEVYVAGIKLRTESMPSLVVDTGSFRGDGWIDLVARRPGRYRVIWRGGPGHHQSKKVTDVVDLVAGDNVWEHDLSPDRWQGEGISLERD
jgi:hypothetical protein